MTLHLGTNRITQKLFVTQFDNYVSLWNENDVEHCENIFVIQLFCIFPKVLLNFYDPYFDLVTNETMTLSTGGFIAYEIIVHIPSN